MRVLVLLALESYRAADYLRGARAAGVDVVVGTETPLAFAETYPDRYLTVPLSDPDAAARAVAGQRFDAVIAADEDTVVAAAHVAEALGIPHISPAAATNARDKVAMRRALTAAGAPQPRFTTMASPEDPGVGFPCVVKPARSLASRGVIRADNDAGLREVAERILNMDGVEPPLVVEEMIQGAEVAVEGIATASGVEVLAIFDKPDPLDGPYFEETIYVTPSRHSRALQAAIKHRVTEAAAALGIDRGPVHAELRLSQDDAVVIELAARTIGGLCGRSLTFSTGMSLEELVIRSAIGQAPKAQRQALAAGVLMLPIPAAGILRGVDGQAEAKAVPNIAGLELTIPLGAEVQPPPDSRRYLGFLFSRAPTAARAEAALREAHHLLRVRIDTAIPTSR